MSPAEAKNVGRTPFIRQTFTAALRINLRVIAALMMREASSRYGHDNIGFFWIMAHPLFLALGVMAVWSVTGHSHGHGVGLAPFVLSGYTPLTLWRHSVAHAVHGLRHHVDLLFHRNIRPLDVLLSGVLLEMAGILTAFFIAYFALTLLGVIPPMRDPLVLLGAWILLTWFCFAFGLIITAVTEIWEAADHFVQPIMYITLPVTGAFTMQYWLPDQARRILSWSPLVNTEEMFRSGLFSADVKTEWDAVYVLICCIALTAIGLPLLHKAQSCVHMG